MKTMIVQSPGNVPASTRIWLTGEQAAARPHLLVADKPDEIEKATTAVARAKMALAKARDARDPDAIDRAEKAREAARAKLNERRLYVTNAQAAFKAGEEIAIDGELDRGLEAMLGIPAPDDAAIRESTEASRAKAEAAAKATADAERKARLEAEAEAKQKAAAEAAKAEIEAKKKGNKD